ncbi:uncharacterized protein LOC133521833 isoform X3 [Cydia pomonella]|uniref:uncharacterized protein LOC133521833 isoform X3 n=1 Tax=Cydia pomonella TaxID=82600 RepID=UPI002ADE3728|nr:uncharacterized protein LOC133521833 isoform X3 [Cydia pomonella]
MSLGGGQNTDGSNAGGIFVQFNQDCTSLVAGSSQGYHLFALTPDDGVEEIYASRSGQDTCLVDRLFSSSLVAVVTVAAPRKLIVCHYKKGTEICNYSYSNTILAVKLNRSRLVVCLEESLHIHNIRDMKILHTIRDTPPNPRGLCALAPAADRCYLAYPGSSAVGEVQIFDAVHLNAKCVLSAHDSGLAALAWSSCGRRLATASERGTVIRVFAVPERVRLFEFRRGVKRCVSISCLAFSACGTFLAASSNTETVHVFRLAEPPTPPTPQPGADPPAGAAASGAAAAAGAGAGAGEAEGGGWLGWLSSAVAAGAGLLPAQVADVLAQGRAFAAARLPIQPSRAMVAITKSVPLLHRARRRRRLAGLAVVGRGGGRRPAARAGGRRAGAGPRLRCGQAAHPAQPRHGRHHQVSTFTSPGQAEAAAGWAGCRRPWRRAPACCPRRWPTCWRRAAPSLRPGCPSSPAAPWSPSPSQYLYFTGPGGGGGWLGWLSSAVAAGAGLLPAQVADVLAQGRAFAAARLPIQPSRAMVAITKSVPLLHRARRRRRLAGLAVVGRGGGRRPAARAGGRRAGAGPRLRCGQAAHPAQPRHGRHHQVSTFTSPGQAEAAAGWAGCRRPWRRAPACCPRRWPTCWRRAAPSLRPGCPSSPAAPWSPSPSQYLYFTGPGGGGGWLGWLSSAVAAGAGLLPAQVADVLAQGRAFAAARLPIQPSRAMVAITKSVPLLHRARRRRRLAGLAVVGRGGGRRPAARAGGRRAGAGPRLRCGQAAHPAQPRHGRHHQVSTFTSPGQAEAAAGWAGCRRPWRRAPACCPRRWPTCWRRAAPSLRPGCPSSPAAPWSPSPSQYLYFTGPGGGGGWLGWLSSAVAAGAGLLPAQVADVLAQGRAFAAARLPIQPSRAMVAITKSVPLLHRARRRRRLAGLAVVGRGGGRRPAARAGGRRAGAGPRLRCGQAAHPAQPRHGRHHQVSTFTSPGQAEAAAGWAGCRRPWRRAPACCPRRWPTCWRRAAPSLRPGCPSSPAAPWSPSPSQYLYFTGPGGGGGWLGWLSSAVAAGAGLLPAQVADVLAQGRAFAAARLPIQPSRAMVAITKSVPLLHRARRRRRLAGLAVVGRGGGRRPAARAGGRRAGAGPRLRCGQAAHPAQPRHGRHHQVSTFTSPGQAEAAAGWAGCRRPWRRAPACCPRRWPTCWRRAAPSLRPGCPSSPAAPWSPSPSQYLYFTGPGGGGGWLGWLSSAVAAGAGLLPAQVADVLAQGRAFAAARLPIQPSRAMVAITNVGRAPRLLVATAGGELFVYALAAAEGGDCALLRTHRLLEPRAPPPPEPTDAAAGNSYAGALRGRDPHRMSGDGEGAE